MRHEIKNIKRAHRIELTEGDLKLAVREYVAKHLASFGSTYSPMNDPEIYVTNRYSEMNAASVSWEE